MSTYPGDDLNIDESAETLAKGLEGDGQCSGGCVPPTMSRDPPRLTAPSRESPDWEPSLAVQIAKNSSVPVNRLPPEVFSGILERRNSERELIIATHVCHQWRSTLTSTPLLWTNIKCCDLTRITTYLKRSQTAPLDVQIVNPPPSFHVQDFLSSSLQRTRSLRVDISPPDLRAVIFRTRTPAPFLQELEFVGFSINNPSGGISPPKEFLGKPAPPLRSIVFTSCPQLSLPFSSLHLTDFNLSTTWAQLTSMRTLLELLSSAPRLQRVSVHISGPITEREVGRDQVILLENLEYLEFHSDRDFVCILPIMKLPHVKDITVALPLGPSAPRSLANLLPHGFGPLLAETDAMAYYGFQQAGHIQFDLPGMIVRVGNSGYMPSATVVTRLLSDERFFSLPRVRKFTIGHIGLRGHNNNPAPDFQNLEILTMACCDARDVLCGLLPSAGKAPCPLLREIIIIPRGNFAREWTTLMRVVKARKKAGCALEKVVIKHRDGSPETPPPHIDLALRKYVQVVQIGDL